MNNEKQSHNMISLKSINTFIRAKGFPRKVEISNPEVIERIDHSTGTVFLKQGDTLREVGKCIEFSIEYTCEH